MLAATPAEMTAVRSPRERLRSRSGSSAAVGWTAQRVVGGWVGQVKAPTPGSSAASRAQNISPGCTQPAPGRSKAVARPGKKQRLLTLEGALGVVVWECNEAPQREEAQRILHFLALQRRQGAAARGGLAVGWTAVPVHAAAVHAGIHATRSGHRASANCCHRRHLGARVAAPPQRTCHLSSVGPKPMLNFVTWMPRVMAARKWPSSWMPTAGRYSSGEGGGGRLVTAAATRRPCLREGWRQGMQARRGSALWLDSGLICFPAGARPCRTCECQHPKRLQHGGRPRNVKARACSRGGEAGGGVGWGLAEDHRRRTRACEPATP